MAAVQASDNRGETRVFSPFSKSRVEPQVQRQMSSFLEFPRASHARRSLSLIVILFSTVALRAGGGEPAAKPTVVVYGATPAGIAAALAAGVDGEHVLLVEPTGRVGGLVTAGLSYTDIRTFESLTGTFLEFTSRVATYYRLKYGDDSEQVLACERGIFAEPKVNLAVFEQMLAEQPRVQVVRNTRLAGVRMGVAEGESTPGRPPQRAILSATFVGDELMQRVVSAKVFIDATYEGDLMAAAGVVWRIGREAGAEYGESLAPETADGQLQAYNFRLTLTRSRENRVAPGAPPGYQREYFLPLLEVLASGRIERIFGETRKCIFKVQEPGLPNGKYDVNDMSGGEVRLSLAGRNVAWPDGQPATRGRIFADHLLDQVGLLYFLQNDDAVPPRFRDEAREWGFCRDEFPDSGHMPPQLYVREARRMIGRHVFCEADTDRAPHDARAVLRSDAIAMGDYGPNCHGTAHEGPRFGGRHTGEFYKPVVPYQVPYGVMVPQDVANLLVVNAVSASHVGFCALRLEPIWTSIGQAAGHAAHLVVGGGCSVADVPLATLQARLHAAGAATIYVSDVPPGHDDFPLVQWWGLQGGWHGLSSGPDTPHRRGRLIHGQYFEAFPDHAANLEHPLDSATAERWSAIASRLGLAVEGVGPGAVPATRGDYLRQLWRQVSKAHPHTHGEHGAAKSPQVQPVPGGQ